MKLVKGQYIAYDLNSTLANVLRYAAKKAAQSLSRQKAAQSLSQDTHQNVNHTNHQNVAQNPNHQNPFVWSSFQILMGCITTLTPSQKVMY